MAGLEDFYPELRGRAPASPRRLAGDARPSSGPALHNRNLNWGANSPSSPNPQRFGNAKVPQLIEQDPPRLVNYDTPKRSNSRYTDIGNGNNGVGEGDSSIDVEHYAGLGISAMGLVLQNVATHPFIVLRRQCQVNCESYRCHRTPFTLVPVVVHLYRIQGFSSLWKGLGSALTVRGLLLAVEDCAGKVTPWPLSVDSQSSLRMVGQHLLLKAVSHAIVVPFSSASLVESVQSDIASEKPGIFDIFKEGLLRLGPQHGSRTLPMWQLIPPTVAHGIAHYIIYTIIKTLSGKIIRSRHRSLQEQQGAVSKPNGAPPGLSQYREQVSSTIGHLVADVILFPIETVLHRLHLQGTRTIIDSLDSGKEVMPIITQYEGFGDCFNSILREEGTAGLFKGFGALVLQYAFHFAILRLTSVSLREVLKVVNSSSEEYPPIPAEYLETVQQQQENRVQRHHHLQQQQEQDDDEEEDQEELVDDDLRRADLNTPSMMESAGNVSEYYTPYGKND